MIDIFWKIFLVNFVFASGTAVGAVAFAALLELTGAEWPGPLRVIAERFRRFFPISFVLYAVLLVGAPAVYPWIRQPVQTSWLRFGPFAWRDAAALAAVYGAALWFCAASARARESTGRAPAAMPARNALSSVAGKASASGGGAPRESKDDASATQPAVAFLIAYAFGSGILAVDLLMSLEPTWGSTLFPAYVSTANLYAGIAAVVVAAAWSAASRSILSDARAHDLGALLLGFGLLWMYLVWSQYFVIWYGNLSEEVGYLLHRVEGGWFGVALMVVAARFAVPLVMFLTGAGKRPRPVVFISFAVLGGFWAECYLLVAPAMSGVSARLLAALVSAVFIGLLFTTVRPLQSVTKKCT